MKRACLTCITALAFSLSWAATTPAQDTSGTHRKQLSRQDLSIPGWEELQVRVDFDPGKSVPNHKHPGEEIIYVIEGTIEYDVAGKAPLTLKAGDVLVVPAGVVHSAKNVGKDNAAELGTYVVPKGKPLLEWAR
ncbi:cupin domain-containing protein [Luteibacter aegosomatissinici]|uniref:cupin domain-containing protein n=1 Tax=Luteibacter aegosomatissinici TaxID=2911539 RepID=UPI001FF8F202|nr:cupin domain-containing protein [Luteibacter aegosomatissinici]UPG94733.1 cupin domain-containing protein [Luteibacter aegosomatissinici]